MTGIIVAMDLEDLLEDLLEDAGKAARRQLRVAGDVVGGKAKRGARRAVRAVGGVTAVTLLVLAVALLAVGSPGAIRIVLGAIALSGAVASGAAATIAHLGERRDPVSKQIRARKSGKPLPPAALTDLSVLPADVRRRWARLLEARTLVGDLAADGWIDGPALFAVDEDMARLHRLLATDRRTEKVGGTRTMPLREQVEDLADLLVALADEAVELQVESTGPRPGAAATLEDARAHLASLRHARKVVDDIDARGRQVEGG